MNYFVISSKKNQEINSLTAYYTYDIPILTLQITRHENSSALQRSITDVNKPNSEK